MLHKNKQFKQTMIKLKIDKTAPSPFCRMCDKKSETKSHIVSEYEKLAQKEYKRMHNNVARIVYQKLKKKKKKGQKGRAREKDTKTKKKRKNVKL